MAKLQIFHQEEVAPAEGYTSSCEVSGARQSKLLSPLDYRLWLYLSELEDGSVIRWDTNHGDEGICVLDGELSVGGRHSGAGGALIVESGVAARAEVKGHARIAHFGSRTPAGGEQGGRWVHLFGPKGQFQVAAPDRKVSSDWFADASCETCEIMLFRVRRGGPEDPRAAHSHSQDEIIYVTEGSILLGSQEFAAGTSLCIPANMRYMQVAGASGCAFINYRSGSSNFTGYPKGQPEHTFKEGALLNGGWLSGDMVNVS